MPAKMNQLSLLIEMTLPGYPLTPIHIDQLIRSKRKTIALVVTRDGRLLVRAPQRASLQLIEGFVQQKAAWISEKQRQALQSSRQALPHAFTAGESFLYLGRAYPLTLSSASRPLLVLAPDGANAGGLCFVLAAAAQARARQVFIDWYRAQAQAVLSERIAHYAALTGLAHSALRITSARTRWGSCSSRGVLSFPWRLVMAPLAAVDYVVVHELIHLTEKNHARPFWQGVARILPDYARQVAWLKANGHLLTFD
jgi:hypothetical protein